VTITTPNESVTFEIKTTGVTANTTMSVKTPCRYGDFCYNKSCEYLHDKTHPIHGAQGSAPAPRSGAPAPRSGAQGGAPAPRTSAPAPRTGAQGGAPAPRTGAQGGASAPRTGAQGGAPAPRTGALAPRTGTSAPRSGAPVRTGAPVHTYKMTGSLECKCNYWHFCGPRCTNMCNDFARNGCPRGQNCRFEHYVEPLSYH